MVKAVIFDIDGTLIDSVDLHAESWRQTFLHFGHDIPYDKVREQIGKGGDLLMPALLPEDEVERRGKEIEDYRQDLFKLEYLPRVERFPMVRACSSGSSPTGFGLRWPPPRSRMN